MTIPGSRGLRGRISGEVVAIVAVFVVSRVALAVAGLSFEPGFVSAIQDIDPALLRDHLLQSLWYLHGQPPLWNALVGVTLKTTGSHWAQFSHVIFAALGLAQALLLFALLVELRASRRVAAAIAIVFSLTPAVLLTENSFFYDYPTLVALTATALAVSRFTRHPTLGRGLLVFGGAAYLVLTRTLFQVWWFLAVAAILLAACRGNRRIVLTAAALPLVLIVAVYAKNWVMFGVPSTSSWTGMGLARVAVVGLPISERRRLVAEGKLHRVSLVKPLAPLAQYEAVGVRPHAKTGIPLLDEASGFEYQRNIENETYIEISREYWSDDLWIIEHRPGSYLRSVGHGLADFFASPSTGWEGDPNEDEIHGYDHWFTRLVYGRLGPGRIGFFVVAAYVAALGFGLALTVRRLRPGADAIDTTIAFAVVTILYVTLTGNLAEVGENYRFRLILDPLVLAMVAVGIRKLAARLRRGRIGTVAATS
ncbi:MAG TPA: hypothetical protein VGM80_17100 [Gaiellaceae bacterium]